MHYAIAADASSVYRLFPCSPLPSDIQLTDVEGKSVGPPLDISLATSLTELTNVVNELLQNDERLPYLFTVDNVEVTSNLARCVAAAAAAATAVLRAAAILLREQRQTPASGCAGTVLTPAATL